MSETTTVTDWFILDANCSEWYQNESCGIFLHNNNIEEKELKGAR
jgi:hypothetical protein